MKKRTAPTDLDHLQGAWTIAGLTMNGESMPPEMLAGACIEIAGDRFTTTGMGADYGGVVILNAATKPPQLDMKFDSGPEKGNTNRGIYQMKGDTWKLCLATQGTKRPRGFVSKPGTGIALETLVRGPAIPVLKKTRAAKAPTGPVTDFEGEWKMVSGVMNGKAMDDSLLHWVKRVTRGNQTTVTAGPQTMLKAEFTFDPLQSPGTIDYVNKNQRGIYKMEKGILTVCVAAPGKPRPAKFESVPGDGRSLTAWKR